MICFYELVNSISQKTISFFCQKAHHGCQWKGKHIIVVSSVVKADFAIYLLLACNFDIIYTILSSISKNHMIKPEIKKKKKKNVWCDLLDGGGSVPGVLVGARPRTYVLI